MARNERELTAEEIILIEELFDTEDNTVIYKDSNWEIKWIVIWADWTVLTSNWETEDPTFKAWGVDWWDIWWILADQIDLQTELDFKVDIDLLTAKWDLYIRNWTTITRLPVWMFFYWLLHFLIIIM